LCVGCATQNGQQQKKFCHAKRKSLHRELLKRKKQNEYGKDILVHAEYNILNKKYFVNSTEKTPHKWGF
jgi:hypothetical protein